MTTKKKVPFKIYLDIDGVAADFEGGFKEITGKYPSQVEKKFLWKTINSDKNFFYDLDVMRGFMNLWDLVEDTEPSFLTGLPGSSSGKEAKIKWVNKHFPGTEVIVVPKKEKRKWAASNHILIDDTMSNIIEWKADGGIGIYHEVFNFHSTISELKDILLKQFDWTI